MVLDQRRGTPAGHGSAVQQRHKAATIHAATVHIGWYRSSGELLEGRSEIDVLDDVVTGHSGRYSGPDHDQWHTDIGVERGLLAGGQPVLAHVVPVVGAEKEVRLSGDTGRRERGPDGGDQAGH